MGLGVVGSNPAAPTNEINELVIFYGSHFAFGVQMGEHFQHLLLCRLLIATRPSLRCPTCDRSKIEQRHADMARMLDDWHPPPSGVPRCACGEPAVIEVSGRSGVEFYRSQQREAANAGFLRR